MAKTTDVATPTDESRRIIIWLTLPRQHDLIKIHLKKWEFHLNTLCCPFFFFTICFDLFISWRKREIQGKKASPIRHETKQTKVYNEYKKKWHKSNMKWNDQRFFVFFFYLFFLCFHLNIFRIFSLMKLFVFHFIYFISYSNHLNRYELSINFYHRKKKTRKMSHLFCYLFSNHIVNFNCV